MLRVIPLTLKQANTFIQDTHRHHKPVVGHRFSIGVVDENGFLAGVSVIGRPVARKTDQYLVAEVTRLCTDGTKNACSFLYAASARICREMGFKKIQTFILDSETGISLKASGWIFTSISDGGDWNCISRTGRRTDQPLCPKQKWQKILSPLTEYNFFNN